VSNTTILKYTHPKCHVTVYPYSEKRFPWQHPPVGPKLSFYLALRGIKWEEKKEKRGERGEKRRPQYRR